MEDRASYLMRKIESKKDRLYSIKVFFIALLFIGVFLFSISQKIVQPYLLIKISSYETRANLTRIERDKYGGTDYYSYQTKDGKNFQYIHKFWEKENGLSSGGRKLINLLYSSFVPSYALTPNRLKVSKTIILIYFCGLIISLISSIMIFVYMRKIRSFERRIKDGFNS